MNSGIYVITNLVNGKKYVGQSIHVNCRIKDYPIRCHNQHLTNSIKKYSWDNFEIKPLIFCEVEDLDYYEDSLIKIWDLMNPKKGYNKVSGGSSHRIVSEETKRKISVATSGKNNPMFGKTFSEETRRKISESNKGKQSKENHPFWGRKMIKEEHPMFGKNHSEESKQKNRDSHLGKKHSEDTKLLMSISRKGKPSPLKDRKISEKHRKKISEVNKIPVIATNIKDNSKIYFAYINEARAYGFDIIGKILRNKISQKYCKGYTFRYATSEEINYYSNLK